MTVKYFNVKNGLSTGNITLDATSGNITGSNLSVTGQTSLGAVGNVSMTGGSRGYFLSTDGNGTLSFVSPASTTTPAPMPTYVPVGTDLSISANYQGIYSVPIVVDGSLTVDGVLVQVDGIVGSSNSQVIFNDYGITTGNANLTFNKATGTLTTNGISLSGNANLGSVSNVHITGGTSGQYLQTDGTGNLTWATGVAGVGSPGGTNGQVQYNNSGSFAGSSSLTFNSASGTLSASNLSVTANATTSNLAITGTVTGNIIPSANGTYSLGNSTNMFANLYMSGNKITFANSSISSNSTVITVATPDASTLILSKDSNLANSVTANYFIGSGNNLSNIQGANVNGYVGYAAIAYSVAGANVIGQVSSALTAGTVTTASQPNITSVGTLVSASVSGNASVGNLITTGVVKTTALTVGTLPSASSVGAGARSFVTDANTTTFLAIVGSGGSNSVPVVSNGTNWIVG